MNQASNYKTPTAPRASHYLSEVPINPRPKPRGSQPPLALDKSSQSSKTTKQTLSNYPSHYYKPESSKNDLIQRVQLTQQRYSKDDGSLNKVNQCSSPREVKGHNWSMPTAGSTINKQAYLNKVQTCSNYKDYAGKLKQPSTETSKGSQIPRFSDLGLMASDDEEPVVYEVAATGSSKSGMIGNRTMIQMKSEKEGFKRKDLLGSGSTLQTRNLRQSGFRQTDFKKGAELGCGKFGKVNVVKHLTTGFVCAMKTVPKAFVKGQNIINQFIRELKIQSCLSHPNIARLYGFFEDIDNIYLLMQLGAQGQLYKVMKRKKRFNQATTIYIIRQLCQAVKYLHGLNILHRDIKPENIVITYGTMKLCDFGWAVCKGTELRSTICGTPLYISPELLKGQQYDEKIDVWAIGILTYELLVGEIPFEIECEEELVKIIKQDIAFPQDIQLSNEAKDFILKILKKNPEDRLKVEKLLQHPFLRRHVQSSVIEL